jgi:pyrroloquinoline quinone biosynthesis protein E
MPSNPEPARPYALLAELTYRCPLKCPYCSNPLNLRLKEGELDTATWKRVLAEAADLGVIQVHFSGGEPLVRRDLAELVSEARRCNLYTHVITSGMGADEPRLAELRKAGLDAIQISLLDSRLAENDWMAGVSSFEQKCNAVEVARKLDFPMTLNVVVHRHNLDRIDEIVDLAVRWDVDRLELAHVQYTGWAFRNRSALLPCRSQVERAADVVAQARERLGNRPQILHVLPDYFQQLPKACLNGWGGVFLTVAPDGVVLPCQTAREIRGLEFPSVRGAPLHDIWFHAPVFNRFRGTDWMPEPCRSCDRREIDFGGCRCQAFLMTGDATATDPVCHLSPDHHLVAESLHVAEAHSAALDYRTYSALSSSLNAGVLSNGFFTPTVRIVE